MPTRSESPEHAAARSVATEGPTRDGMRMPMRSGAPTLPERYVQQEELGKGGMGIVYAALDRMLGRRIAIKWVRAGASGELARRRRARLVREARAIAALSHPNVVAVFDVGEVEGDVWVAMELVDGVDLRRWSMRGPHDWRTVLDVFVQAGEGLAAAHVAGLVHRDFKPANVMIDDPPRGGRARVRVLDFGLARAETSKEQDVDPSHDGDDDGLTATGQRVGTPAYMSPEQHAGEDADARSDQFSFCVALHEALFGARPFVGDDAATITRAVLDDRRSAVPRDRAVPAWLRRVVQRGTSIRPEHRFPSMRALLDHVARRRVRSGRLGVLAAACGLGLGAWALAPAAAEPCPELDLATVWNDARRAELVAGVLASDAEFAHASAELVVRGLDRRAEQLRSASAQACMPVRDEPMIACLRGRMVALSSYVDELVGADAATVEIATAALAELPDAERCEDVTRRDVDAPRPGERRLADVVTDLRVRATEVRGLLNLARYERAVADARALVVDAAAAGFAPVHAEALALLGDALYYGGDPAQAEATFREALWLAEGEGHDAVMVEAAVELAWLRYEGGASDQEIDRLIATAEAAARRADDLGHYRAVLINVDASRLLARGRSDQAGARWQEALRWTLAHGDPDDAHLPDLLHNLGNAQLLGDAPELALWSYVQALELTLRQRGAEHPASYTERQSVADALAQLGRAEQSLPIYADVLAWRERWLDADDPRIASSRANYGSALRKAGRAGEAVSMLELAIARKRELGAGAVSLARTHTELARAQADAGDPVNALTTVEHALGLLDGEGEVAPHELAAPLGVLADLLERSASAATPGRRALGERLATRLGDDALRRRFTGS